MVKFGPWASSDIWALVRGTLKRFFTHFSNCAVIVVVVVVAATGGVVVADVVLDVVVVVVVVNTVVGATLHVCSCWLFKQPPPVFEHHSLFIQISLIAFPRWICVCIPSPS